MFKRKFRFISIVTALAMISASAMAQFFFSPGEILSGYNYNPSAALQQGIDASASMQRQAAEMQRQQLQNELLEAQIQQMRQQNQMLEQQRLQNDELLQAQIRQLRQQNHAPQNYFGSAPTVWRH
jgi:cell shape-determining protein MreC